MTSAAQPVAVPPTAAVAWIASPWKGRAVVEASITSDAPRGLTRGTHDLFAGMRSGDFSNRYLHQAGSLDAAIAGAQLALQQPVQRGAQSAQAVLRRGDAYYFGGLENAEGWGAEAMATRRGVSWKPLSRDLVGVVLGEQWVPMTAKE